MCGSNSLPPLSLSNVCVCVWSVEFGGGPIGLEGGLIGFSGGSDWVLIG